MYSTHDAPLSLIARHRLRDLSGHFFIQFGVENRGLSLVIRSSFCWRPWKSEPYRRFASKSAKHVHGFSGFVTKVHAKWD